MILSPAAATILAALAFLTPAGAASPPNLSNKTVLLPQGADIVSAPILWKGLKPTTSTWDQWSWGRIPEACDYHARFNHLQPYDIEVFNVHYKDCGQAWTFCRHHNAAMSQIDMIDQFGRLPVRERRWVRHFIALPMTKYSPGFGTASTMDFIFYGLPSPANVQFVVAQILDRYKNKTPMRFDPIFLNAIPRDSCVPDAFSKSSVGVDLMQTSVLALVEYASPTGLDAITNGPRWRCLVNQKNAINKLFGDAIKPGGTCGTRPFANSKTIKMSAFVEKPKRRGEPEGAIEPPATGHVDGALMWDVVGTSTVDEEERARATQRAIAWQKAAGKEVPLWVLGQK